MNERRCTISSHVPIRLLLFAAVLRDSSTWLVELWHYYCPVLRLFTDFGSSATWVASNGRVVRESRVWVDVETWGLWQGGQGNTAVGGTYPTVNHTTATVHVSGIAVLVGVRASLHASKNSCLVVQPGIDDRFQTLHFLSYPGAYLMLI